MEPKSLGRLIEFDDRSREYPIRALLSTTKKPRSYTWRCDTWLDQGASSSCVGHSWAHEIAARPAVDVVTSADAFSIYRRAQELDQWPGEDPQVLGSSIIAGAKATMETGRMTEYRWAFSMDDLIMAVGNHGPVIAGTIWTSSMFEVNPDGFLKEGGSIAGGHAYLINGISIKNKYFKIHNSWGQSWGDGGKAKISFDHMEKLMYQNGEFCVPVKRVRSY